MLIRFGFDKAACGFQVPAGLDLRLSKVMQPSEHILPYGRQTITEDDITSVMEVLRSPLLTQGPAVPAFEQALAAKVGAAHGVAVNSATSALHLACLALGLGPEIVSGPLRSPSWL